MWLHCLFQAVIQSVHSLLTFFLLPQKNLDFLSFPAEELFGVFVFHMFIGLKSFSRHFPPFCSCQSGCWDVGLH